MADKSEWLLGYPINYTLQGDLTTEGIYKHIQELSKVYGHLNYLRSNTEGGASINIAGFAPLPEQLPPSANVNDVYLTNGEEYNLYVWDGLQWNKLNIDPIPVATTEQPGLAQLGTLAGVRSDIPSPTKVVTEELLANYRESGSSGVPSGTIISWWGNPQNIPAGWAYCDGTAGTPDLRDKFIKNTADKSAMGGTTGGRASYSLQSQNLPAHYHSLNNSISVSGSASAHTHTLSGSFGSHTHNVNGYVTSAGDHRHACNNSGVYMVMRNTKGQGTAVVQSYQSGTSIIATTLSGGGSSADVWTEGFVMNAGGHQHQVNINTNSAGGGSLSGSTGSGGGGTVNSSGTLSGNTGSVGNAAAIDNNPLHMELVMIMKL